MLYDKLFIDSVPLPLSREKRPLVNLKAHNLWLLNKLNDWYEELLPDGDVELYSRLRDLDPPNFMGAFWELVILRCLRELGHDVQYNLSLEGKKPDLFWRRSALVADVISVSDPMHSETSQVHMAQLTQRINTLPFKFNVSIIRFKFEGERNPRFGEITKWLERLRALPSDDLYSATHIYKTEGVELEFLISPRTEGQIVKGLGMFPLNAESLKKAIKGRLREKVKKYKRPLVVFVCRGLGFWPADEDTVHMSLYGDWVIRFSAPRSIEDRSGTATNGVFNNRMGSGGRPANTEISSVVFAEWNVRDERLHLQLKAYHNPFAVQPLAQDFFAPMAQYVVSRDDGQNLTLEWIDKNNGLLLGDPIPTECRR